jgi:hypothetical protein
MRSSRRRWGQRIEKVHGFRIGMAFDAAVWFRFHREGAIDRSFKSWGLSTETQTGDAAFDEAVYIACDHPSLAVFLRRSAEARAAIKEAFDKNIYRLYADGSTLWLERRGEVYPDNHDLATLSRIVAALEPFRTQAPDSLWSDPFLWKAFAIEGVVWSIAAYALVSTLEFTFSSRVDIYLDWKELIAPSAVMAGVLFGVVGVGVVSLLRGSSRGHRILIESALILVLSLPIASLQLTSDINRKFDSSVAQTVAAEVQECEKRLSRRSRRSFRRTRTSYYVHLAWNPQLEELDVPHSIRVAQPLCRTGTFTADVKKGRLGVPWYQRIEVDGFSWSAP